MNRFTVSITGTGAHAKPHTRPQSAQDNGVVPLAFDDVPFEIERFRDSAGARHRCRRCGAMETFLDEIPLTGQASLWQCNDQDRCAENVGYP